ncbi:MAG: hypothetical protein ACK50J_26730, partial [Planctomyces sp.]
MEPSDLRNLLSGFSRSPASTQFSDAIARRTFLNGSGVSLGSMALSALLAESASSGMRSLRADERGNADSSEELRWQGVLQPLPRIPKAKRVIWLYMA